MCRIMQKASSLPTKNEITDIIWSTRYGICAISWGDRRTSLLNTTELQMWNSKILKFSSFFLGMCSTTEQRCASVMKRKSKSNKELPHEKPSANLNKLPRILFIQFQHQVPQIKKHRIVPRSLYSSAKLINVNWPTRSMDILKKNGCLSSLPPRIVAADFFVMAGGNEWMWEGPGVYTPDNECGKWTRVVPLVIIRFRNGSWKFSFSFHGCNDRKAIRKISLTC